MSISIMSKIFKSDIHSTSKFVLVAIADHADERGYCYPSVATICGKCNLSERTVRHSIGILEKLKLIKVVKRVNTSNEYWIELDPQKMYPKKELAGAGYAGVQDMHPRGADYAPLPLQDMHPNHHMNHQLIINKKQVIQSMEEIHISVVNPPPEDMYISSSPHPEVTSTILVDQPKSKSKSLARNRNSIDTPPGVTPNTYADYLTVRKSPFTNTALKMLQNQVDKTEPRITLEEAFQLMAGKGWQGFKAGWEKDSTSNKSASATTKKPDYRGLL